jgi:hypothetical protein
MEDVSGAAAASPPATVAFGDGAALLASDSNGAKSVSTWHKEGNRMASHIEHFSVIKTK